MLNSQKQKINLTIPTSLNFILGNIIESKRLSNKINYMYIYNENFYTLIFLSKYNVFVDCSTRTIKFSFETNYTFTKKFIKMLLIFVKALFTYFFRKIKYTGKSFKIEKINSLIFDFKFGHAKKTYVVIKNKIIKQIKKTKKFY